MAHRRPQLSSSLFGSSTAVLTKGKRASSAPSKATWIFFLIPWERAGSLSLKSPSILKIKKVHFPTLTGSLKRQFGRIHEVGTPPSWRLLFLKAGVEPLKRPCPLVFVASRGSFVFLHLGYPRSVRQRAAMPLILPSLRRLSHPSSSSSSPLPLRPAHPPPP